MDNTLLGDDRVRACVHSCSMAKQIRIRGVDDALHAALVRRAAETGITVPELLRSAASRLVERPSMTEWLERTRSRSIPTSSDRVVEALDELRGPWVDAPR